MKLIVPLIALVLMFLGGCAAGDPKPRAAVSAQSVTDEGPKNPTRVDTEGVAGSTLYPSTSVLLQEGLADAEGTQTQPARMHLNKPSSTTTAWSGPFDTWLDAAGIVTATDIKAVTPEGATIEAASITIDNKSTLEGAALYASAIEQQVIAMSADQREAYRAYVTEFASTVRETFPALADLLVKALIPVP